VVRKRGLGIPAGAMGHCGARQVRV
jgi:hypothetical protein